MEPLSLIVFLIVGTIAGMIAAKVMHNSLGVLASMGVGVLGAFIGGFLLSLVGLAFAGWLGTFVSALIGAIALLGLVNLVTRRRVRH